MLKKTLITLVCIIIAGAGCTNQTNEIPNTNDNTVTKKACIVEGVTEQKVSPNRNFILYYCDTPGDSQFAEIYSVKDNSIYKIKKPISGIAKSGWLKSEKLFMYEGCVLANYCKRYESMNSDKPWEIEFTSNGVKDNEQL